MFNSFARISTSVIGATCAVAAAGMICATPVRAEPGAASDDQHKHEGTGGAMNVNVTNPSLTVGNSSAAPLNTTDVLRSPAHLIHAGQAFDLPPNPNVAFELDVPPNVVLTDAELTLNGPALAATIFVCEMDNSQTYAFQLVGTPGTTWGSNEGHYGLHLQSGIASPIGLRVGIYCNNIGGNSCAGAMMWSGYQP